MRLLAIALFVCLLPCGLALAQGRPMQAGGDDVLLRVGDRELLCSDYVQAQGGLEAIRAKSRTAQDEALESYIDFHLLVREAESMRLDTTTEVHRALSLVRRTLLRQWFEQIEKGGEGAQPPADAPTSGQESLLSQGQTSAVYPLLSQGQNPVGFPLPSQGQTSVGSPLPSQGQASAQASLSSQGQTLGRVPLSSQGQPPEHGPFVDEVLLSQITFLLSQHVPSTDLETAKQRMDSIHRVMGQGIDFEALVERFSAVPSPLWMPLESLSPEMETIVRSLSTGQASAPFWTPEGLHIVKVLDRRSQPTLQALGATHAGPSQTLIDRLQSEFAYTPQQDAIDELLASGSTSRVLFTLGGMDDRPLHSYDGQLFDLFARSHPQTIRRQLEGFTAKSVMDYAARVAMLDNGPAAKALQTQRDSLLYQALIRHLLADRLTPQALQAYFRAHQADYRYSTPRYRGTVIHARTKRALKQARKFLRDLPPEEHQQAIGLVFRDSINPEVVIEQGVFTLGDNPFVDQLAFSQGKARPLSDHPFTQLLGEKIKGPDDYTEVLPRLRDDCARAATSKWAQALRSQTKVEINQEVLKTVNNR